MGARATGPDVYARGELALEVFRPAVHKARAGNDLACLPLVASAEKHRGNTGAEVALGAKDMDRERRVAVDRGALEAGKAPAAVRSDCGDPAPHHEDKDDAGQLQKSRPGLRNFFVGVVATQALRAT